MLKTKLNVIASFAIAAFGGIIALTEPALAGLSTVPAPIVGAGLPALAILGGGYWVIRKLRGPR
jgi:hypothetical protein